MTDRFRHNTAGERQSLLGNVSQTFSNTDCRAGSSIASRGVDTRIADDADIQSCPGTREESWREWVSERLESRGMHKFVLSLIIIDALCVLADLTYTVLEPECPQSLLSQLHAFPHALPSQPQVFEAHDTPEPVWLSILAHISLAITTLFVFEIPLALWCFGLRYYAPLGTFLDDDGGNRTEETREDAEQGMTGDRQRLLRAPQGLSNLRPHDVSTGYGATEAHWRPYAALHLFDAFVVFITFILEAVLRGGARELAGLLVILRLWRLVKLVGGMAVGAGELAESLSKELEESQERITHLEHENAALRKRLVFLDTSAE